MTHNCTKIMQDNIYERGVWYYIKIILLSTYTYYWQLRQTDPWLMGSSSLANGAIFFLANVIVVILANGIKSLG